MRTDSFADLDLCSTPQNHIHCTGSSESEPGLRSRGDHPLGSALVTAEGCTAGRAL